jgi:hypothetical protein
MKDKDSVARSQFLRSISIPFPFLIILGVVIGYVKYGDIGILFGILGAAVSSLVVGILATIFTGKIGKSASSMLYARGKSTINLRERLEGDLQQARFHKMNHRYEKALWLVNGALEQVPNFADALFLKAQILWEGFGNSMEAKACIKEVMQRLPHKNAPLHRWAAHLLAEINQSVEDQKDPAVEP